MSKAKISMIVRILDTDPPRAVEVFGRDAWALQNLINAGAQGCTPITHAGPRWSHYVWKLREAGVNVETIDEAHGGPFSGHHARYVLRSRIEVIGGGAMLGVAA